MGPLAVPLIGLAGGLASAGIGAATQSKPYAPGKRYFDKDVQAMMLGELGQQLGNWGDPVMANYLQSQPGSKFSKQFAQHFGGSDQFNPDLAQALGATGYSPTASNPQRYGPQFTYNPGAKFGYGGGGLGGYNAGYGGPLNTFHLFPK